MTTATSEHPVYCRKINYKTQARAEKALRRIGQQQSGPRPRRVYQCDYCGFWHLTRWEVQPS